MANAKTLKAFAGNLENVADFFEAHAAGQLQAIAMQQEIEENVRKSNLTPAGFPEGRLQLRHL